MGKYARERRWAEMAAYGAESAGWSLSYEGGDLMIQGPGGLEIVVCHFDQTKIQHNEPLSPEVVGDPPQLDWLYTLEGGITLHLVSSSSPEGEALHRLRVSAEGVTGGWQVGWHLPDDIAAMLYQLEPVSGGG
jgi:hypothetical protein